MGFVQKMVNREGFFRDDQAHSWVDGGLRVKLTLKD
jgi:hypothetical protein